jgi:hypothetical protein
MSPRGESRDPTVDPATHLRDDGLSMNFAYLLPLATIAVACGSSGGSPSSSLPECPDDTVPSTLSVAVTGFVTCTCLNGMFTLSETTAGVWASPAIDGCPGQRKPAYFKFTNSPATSDGLDGMNGGAPSDAGTGHTDLGFGVTDQASIPGGGDSDISTPTAVTCSPLRIAGGGAKAGNITDFCPSAEDEEMKCTISGS